MRATWLTSLIAGIGFGVLCRIVDTAEETIVAEALTKQQAFYGLLVMFVLSTVFAVVGVTQIRELHAEHRRRGVRVMMDAADFTAYYFPTWGRMTVWFLAVASSSLLTKTLGL